jgi:alkylated DNA nucleotide flippase Atl1
MNKVAVIVSEPEKAAANLAERHVKQGIVSTFGALAEYACMVKQARAKWGVGVLIPMKNAYQTRLDQLKGR